MQLITVGEVTIDERKQATRFLCGRGIEIGAAVLPIEVDTNCAEVRYVDRLQVSEQEEKFPEHTGVAPVPVDVVCDIVTDGLSPFEDGSLDFVIASHVLEHIPNPLGFIAECHRVLRSGGIFYLVVPDKDFTFDRDRQRTALHHVVQEYKNDVRTIDEAHLVDYLVNAAKATIPGDPAEKKQLFDRELGRSFHVHVWTWEDVVEMLKYLTHEEKMAWELPEMYLPKGVKHEIICILQKSSVDAATAAQRFDSSFQALLNRERSTEELIRIAGKAPQAAVAAAPPPPVNGARATQRIVPARVRQQVGRVLDRLKSAAAPGDILVRAAGSQDVYVVSGGAKRRIPSIQAFRALGYKDSAVKEIPADVMEAIPNAPAANGHFVSGKQEGPTLPTYESFKRTAPVDELQCTAATRCIFDRLSPAQIDKIVGGITAEEAVTLSISSEADRMRSIISLAAYYRQEDALGAMQLAAALPPEEIHAMSRGPFTLAGGCKYADLVVQSLGGGGETVLRPGARALDFGCSSGRVVRMLASAYPEVEWNACDPNPDSIQWDEENLPSIKFTVSGDNPPLSQYADATFDLVFAISIWSHFAEKSALRWLEEMRRIIKPGGTLVFTTHGFRAIDYLAENQLYDVRDLARIRDELYSSGLCFLDVFGNKGDWGIVNSEWGQTFMSPEWLLSHACPQWIVTEYGLGRVENNQDVYTLQRR